MKHGELTSRIPAALPEELIDILSDHGGVRIERIVSRGHTSPPDFWYDQEEHEFVLLVQGEARLDIEGRPALSLTAGTWVLLPAHTKHRVAFTPLEVDTIWLAIFYGP